MGGDDQLVHEVASSGDVSKLESLLDEDPALVCAKGWFDRTPLHAAAQAGSLACVRLLVERGADVNVRDGLHSWTPLFGAVWLLEHKPGRDESLACARFLLEHGADPNVRDTHRRETPVFGAHALDAVLLLESFGADLDVVSSEDEYAFESHARGVCAPELLAFWLRRGVDVNHVPGYGNPALVGVLVQLGKGRRGEAEVGQVRALLEYGADTEIAEHLHGNTALHTAAAYGREDLARILLDGGADPNSRNHSGATPLHAAAEKGTAKVLRLLVSRGADPNARDLWERLPLELAARDGLREILEPLTRAAAPERPSPEELIGRMLEVPRLRGASLRGCREEEIAGLESRFGVRLPESYRKFLRFMGRGPRGFLERDHWEAFYPDLLRMGQGAEYEYACADLPPSYFVFASRLTLYLFFVADGSAEDPPVYAFGDGHDGGHKKSTTRSGTSSRRWSSTTRSTAGRI